VHVIGIGEGHTRTLADARRGDLTRQFNISKIYLN
jgi:hypothetical protein